MAIYSETSGCWDPEQNQEKRGDDNLHNGCVWNVLSKHVGRLRMHLRRNSERLPGEYFDSDQRLGCFSFCKIRSSSCYRRGEPAAEPNSILPFIFKAISTKSGTHWRAFWLQTQRAHQVQHTHTPVQHIHFESFCVCDSTQCNSPMLLTYFIHVKVYLYLPLAVVFFFFVKKWLL